MNQDSTLQIFQVVSDPHEADAIIEQLHGAGIIAEKSKNKLLLDKVIIGAAMQDEINILIPANEFLNAHKVLENYYEEDIDNIDPQYFLYEFSDLELQDVLAKPDEWGHFNVALAKKLLKERGIADAVDTVRLANVRNEQLSKKESAEFSLTMGYLSFALCIALAFISPYLVSIAMHSFPIVIGLYVWKNKRTLPDGSITAVFNEKSRRYAKILALLSGALFLSLCTYLIISNSPLYK